MNSRKHEVDFWGSVATSKHRPRFVNSLGPVLLWTPLRIRAWPALLSAIGRRRFRECAMLRCFAGQRGVRPSTASLASIKNEVR